MIDITCTQCSVKLVSCHKMTVHQALFPICTECWKQVVEIKNDLRKRLLSAGASSSVPLVAQGDGSYKHLCPKCDTIHWKDAVCVRCNLPDGLKEIYDDDIWDDDE